MHQGRVFLKSEQHRRQQHVVLGLPLINKDRSTLWVASNLNQRYPVFLQRNVHRSLYQSDNRFLAPHEIFNLNEVLPWRRKVAFMFSTKTCSCSFHIIHCFGRCQVFSEWLIFCFSIASFSAFFLSNSTCFRFSSRAWLNILRKFSNVVITRGKRGMMSSWAPHL